MIAQSFTAVKLSDFNQIRDKINDYLENITVGTTPNTVEQFIVVQWIRIQDPNSIHGSFGVVVRSSHHRHDSHASGKPSATQTIGIRMSALPQP